MPSVRYRPREFYWIPTKKVRDMAYGGYRNDRERPKEFFKTTCSDCGAECEVPFKPTQGRPVY